MGVTVVCRALWGSNLSVLYLRSGVGRFYSLIWPGLRHCVGFCVSMLENVAFIVAHLLRQGSIIDYI